MNEMSNRDVYARVATECACNNFRKASRAVTQFFDGRLEPSGLRATQFTVLVALAALEPLSVARLSRELVMDPSTVNRNLKPLENSGLVVKQAPDRGRRVVLTLTEEGWETLRRSLPLWQSAQDQFVSGLNNDWVGLRSRLADAIRSAVGPGET